MFLVIVIQLQAKNSKNSVIHCKASIVFQGQLDNLREMHNLGGASDPIVSFFLHCTETRGASTRLLRVVALGIPCRLYVKKYFKTNEVDTLTLTVAFLVQAKYPLLADA